MTITTINVYPDRHGRLRVTSDGQPLPDAEAKLRAWADELRRERVAGAGTPISDAAIEALDRGCDNSEIGEYHRAVVEKMRRGAIEYGDGSFSRLPDALLAELAEEAVDIGGWAHVLRTVAPDMAPWAARLFADGWSLWRSIRRIRQGPPHGERRPEALR